MGKGHCDHRVVVRDPNDRIVADHPFDSFARAQPEYERLAATVADGHELTLQHGARVIFRTAKKNTRLSDENTFDPEGEQADQWAKWYGFESAKELKDWGEQAGNECDD